MQPLSYAKFSLAALFGVSAVFSGCFPQLEVTVDISNSYSDPVYVQISAHDANGNQSDDIFIETVPAQSDRTYHASFNWSTDGEGLAPFLMYAYVNDNDINGTILGSHAPFAISDGETLNIAVLPDGSVEFSISGATSPPSLSKQVQNQVSQAVQWMFPRHTPKK